MNIKHIVYTFSFMALMGVTSKTSEAMTIINTSDKSFYVEIVVKHVNDNGESIEGYSFKNIFHPGDTTTFRSMIPSFNTTCVEVKIYRMITDDEHQQTITMHMQELNEAERTVDLALYEGPLGI